MAPPLTRTTLLLLLSWQTAFAAINAIPEPEAATNGIAKEAEPDLSTLVESYFKEADGRERRKIAVAITARDDANLNSVADAIRSAGLWEDKQPGVERIVLPTSRSRKLTTPIEVHVRIPEGYDPDKAHPLVIVVPDAEVSAEKTIEHAVGALRHRADEFLVAVPTHLPPVALSSPPDAIKERLVVLRALRHRFHVDTNRAYLIGKGQGGHAAATWATLDPHHFAGALAIQGTLTLQLPGEAAEPFLANLNSVPTVLLYSTRCTPTVQSTERETGGQKPDEESATDEIDATCQIAAWNRYIGHLANRDKLPIRTIGIDADSLGFESVSADALNDLLEHTRDREPRKLSLLFRYPDQGRIGWLKQTRFLGEPWTAHRIQVAPAPSESEGQALRAVLTEKLAYIEGEIEGQSITLTTRRTEKIELRLNEKLIDLENDITIVLDGTKRFEDRVKPSIRTMLEIAQADWEFQTLWPVRFQIDHKGRAIQR